MTDNRSTRQVHDVSRVSSDLDSFLETAETVGFSTAFGSGRRVGGSLERDNLSQYDYINTAYCVKNRALRETLKLVATSLNVKDHMLTHNFLKLNPGDFLDWQDYYMWKSRSQIIEDQVIIGPVVNFFSIALTEGNLIEFKDEIIDVPQYHGIVFHPSDMHRIPAVENTHIWLVLGIPSHLDVSDLITNI